MGSSFKLIQMARINISKSNLGGNRFVLMRLNAQMDILVVDIFDDCSEIF